MTAFADLSALLRGLFALWALLLCLAVLAGAVLAVVQKRFFQTALALPLLAPIYLLWQVIFDLSLFGMTPEAAGISRTLGALPWPLWLLALLFLSLPALGLLFRSLRYDRTNLTPGTVKLFLDRLPSGVLCWKENGRVLLANDCMNRLCMELTGEALLSGNQFRDAVAEGIRTVDGRVWRFSCRELHLNGETLHEMIASDITSEYAKTQALEQDKAELSALNLELQEYYRSIDDTVRRQEILQAKVNIHDEMNRLMLSTTAADVTDVQALDRIFSLWEQNALLLCMEAENAGEVREADGLEQLAAALGLRLLWKGELPEALTQPQRSLFYSCAREAMANAVKHAQAKTMEVSFAETETVLCCRFTNDGKLPSGSVRSTGGLANLSTLAKRQEASVDVRVTDTFTLTLSFPKNQPIG